MNNGYISLPREEEEVTPKLREEETRLMRIIEAIRSIKQSEAWRTLQEEKFDGLVVMLEKDLKSEARKEHIDLAKLNRLAGQLEWAEKYADLTKLENQYMNQLTNIRLKLNGKTD